MRVIISDRNPDGRGRGRAGKKIALVSQAHPGEEVAMRVDRTTGGTVQGRVARLVTADPDRFAHPCSHEFRCTGCSLLAATPAAEESFKSERLSTALAAALDSPPVIDPLVTPAGPFGYRHFAKQIFGRVRGQMILGSYVTGTHQVVDNRDCPVLVPALARLMAAVVGQVSRARLRLHEGGGRGLRYAVGRASAATGELLLILVTSDPELDRLRPAVAAIAEETPDLRGTWGLYNPSSGSTLLTGRGETLWGTPEISEELLGYRHRVGAESFFQINPAAAQVIFETAVELAGEGSRCLEGFAGVGALTLPLSDRFEQVTAVESHGPSVRALVETARRYDRGQRVTAIEDDARQDLPARMVAACPEVLVLDPPRRGLGPELVAAIAAATVPRLVLVACGVDALAQDLPGLTAAGYRIDRVVPIDQFPRTGHLETVVRLSHG